MAKIYLTKEDLIEIGKVVNRQEYDDLDYFFIQSTPSPMGSILELVIKSPSNSKKTITYDVTNYNNI